MNTPGFSQHTWVLHVEHDIVRLYDFFYYKVRAG